MLQTLWAFPAFTTNAVCSLRCLCIMVDYVANTMDFSRHSLQMPSALSLLMHHGRLCCKHYGHFPLLTTNVVCSLNCLCIMVDYVANTRHFPHHGRLCCKQYGHFLPFTTNAICSLNCLCIMVDYVVNTMDISHHSLQLLSAL